MKRFIRAFTVFAVGITLAFSMMMSGAKASAEEIETDVTIDEDDPYVMVWNASCYLSISSGTATVSSSVMGKSGVTSISVTVYLEKFVAGSWQPYTSWSHNDSSSLDSTDYTSVSSGAYRVWMSVGATGTNGSESFDVNGNTAGC